MCAGCVVEVGGQTHCKRGVSRPQTDQLTFPDHPLHPPVPQGTLNLLCIFPDKERPCSMSVKTKEHVPSPSHQNCHHSRRHKCRSHNDAPENVAALPSPSRAELFFRKKEALLKAELQKRILES